MGDFKTISKLLEKLGVSQRSLALAAALALVATALTVLLTGYARAGAVALAIGFFVIFVVPLWVWDLFTKSGQPSGSRGGEAPADRENAS